MKVKEKDYFFEGLPRFEFKSRPIIKIVDDKYLVKKILKREKFPVLDGKSFWFFQKRKAINFAINLGFPLVVKPRSGSLSEAVTCNIKDKKFLAFAISRAISYSPTFIVEKYLPNSYVFRATVIDFDKIFCVKQIPANIVGDGTHDIKELIEIKNNNSKRGEMSQKTILKKIIVNDVTKKLLEEKNYTFLTIPQKREIVFLQKDSFLKLGGDLVEVTNSIHPDNLSLFSEIARLFDIRIVGIDFLAKDISLSWKNQESTILELNSLPAIEMHYFPTIGKKQNVASSIVKMTLKYLKD